MKYLLVNHIPAGRGRDDAHLRLPPAWARDLAAAGRVAREMSIRLVVATPVSAAPILENTQEIVPDQLGFEHVAIPGYHSARTFIRERAAIEAAIASLVAGCDVVQLDHGGHPMPLGLVAAPIALDAGTPTLWVVVGDQLPDSRLARSAGTLAKRAIGRPVDSRIRRDAIAVLRKAAAVVTTNPKVSDALLAEHDIPSTPIETLDATDADLRSPSELAERQSRLLDTTRPLRLALRGQQTIDRGTDHVLAAMHRCWRLRVPVELVLDLTGGEAAVVRKRAQELGLSAALFPAATPADFDEADVLLDVALSNVARTDLDVPLARGLAPIAYAPRRTLPHVVALERGDVDALAEAIFQAASNRAELAARIARGVEWAREHTLEAAYRKRFAIVRNEAGGTGYQPVNPGADHGLVGRATSSPP